MLLRVHRRHRWYFERLESDQLLLDSVCVHLRLFLCRELGESDSHTVTCTTADEDIGTGGMGRHRRDLPITHSLQRRGTVDGKQLVSNDGSLKLPLKTHLTLPRFWNCIISVITPFIVDEDKGNLGVRVFFVWG